MTPAAQRDHPAARRRAALLALRLVAVAGLVVDVQVHLELAPLYDALGADISQGALFRLEAALAALAAGFLLLRDSRPAWAAAGLVALAGAVAVVVTRYLQLPALGPVPAMYDPQWTTDKVVVTVAMGATVLAWAVREVLRARPVRAHAQGGATAPGRPRAAAHGDG